MTVFAEGTVVISKRGHDRGDCLAVIEVIDENYVLIADGKNRKIEKPKKKKVKHLKKVGDIGALTEERKRGGLPLTDNFIRAALRPYIDEYLEGKKCQKTTL